MANRWAVRAVKRLRLGVVGGGFGAAFFWHEHPGCVVTAVSDLRPERRHLLRERYRTDKVYEEFHPMLKDPDADAVAIWSGAPDHAQHCIDSLNAGKHVICAVPAAMTLEDCQRRVDTVRRTGLTYMMAETSCFHSATMTARKLRMDGIRGEYLHDLAEFHPGQKPSGLLKDEGRETGAVRPRRPFRNTLPPQLRKYTTGGHKGSEVYITNEFVNACNEGRRPLLDVFEAVDYCAPGICAHESALNDGDWVKVPDFGWHA